MPKLGDNALRGVDSAKAVATPSGVVRLWVLHWKTQHPELTRVARGVYCRTATRLGGQRRAYQMSCAEQLGMIDWFWTIAVPRLWPDKCPPQTAEEALPFDPGYLRQFVVSWRAWQRRNEEAIRVVGVRKAIAADARSRDRTWTPPEVWTTS